ncbi:MAG: hypothetical protein GXP54_08350, partial [Deltaproteobacteria bacterium]|nr:hypothetical protein [Deltaproteobacteria bacterium]
MSNLEKWWSTWAPYWSLMEERHFGTAAAGKYLDLYENPVLVVGAGTGL